MFMLRGAFLLFLSLAVGYVVCVLAKKQDGVLKTVGYTLGAAIITLTLLYGVVESISTYPKGHGVCSLKDMQYCKTHMMKMRHK